MTKGADGINTQVTAILEQFLQLLHDDEVRFKDDDSRTDWAQKLSLTLQDIRTLKSEHNPTPGLQTCSRCEHYLSTSNQICSGCLADIRSIEIFLCARRADGNNEPIHEENATSDDKALNFEDPSEKQGHHSQHIEFENSSEELDNSIDQDTDEGDYNYYGDIDYDEINYYDNIYEIDYDDRNFTTPEEFDYWFGDDFSYDNLFDDG